MMQGSRDLHRRWWLSKRFSIFDAKYVSGTYKSDAVEIKCLNGTEAGQQFTITAGYPLDYGYGINNKPREKGVTLNIGDSYTFTTQEVVNVGDPIRIYGAPNISELDLSRMTGRLATLTVTNANSDTLGTKMKKLVVGNPNVANMELKEISGLKKLTSLDYLDIQGLKNVTSLDLTSQPQLKELKAFGSNIASVSFAKGAPVEKLELPTSVTSLDLNQLTRLTTENLLFESGMNGISSISIKGCPKLSKNFAWVYNWYVGKTTPNETSSLVMDNVDWKDVDAGQLAALTNLGHISLKGKVTVTDITLEQLNMLIDVFGESAFDKNAELFINAPDAIFVTGRTELLEGESEDYACIVFGAEVQGFTWSIYSGGSSSDTTIDATTGLLTTKEGSGARTLTIRVVARTDAGTKTKDITVKVAARTYPASGTTTLSGSSRLNETREIYKLDVATPNVNGEYVVTWSLTGMDGYAEIESSSNTQCVIKKVLEPAVKVLGTLTCAIKKKANNYSLFSKTFSIEFVNDTIAETDEGVVTALYNAGLCANSAYITKEEAALITDVDLQHGTSYSTSIFYAQRSKIKSFDGFQYFTSVTKVSSYLFSYCTQLKSLRIPEGVSTIENYSIAEYTTSVYFPSTVSKITGSSFGTGSHDVYSRKSNVIYEVSEDNPFYMSHEGGLYTRNGCLIKWARSASVKDLVFPEWVNEMGYHCICMESLDSITFTGHVKMNSSAFNTVYLRNSLSIYSIEGSPQDFRPLDSSEKTLYIGGGLDSRAGLFFAQDTLSFFANVECFGGTTLRDECIYSKENVLIRALNGAKDVVIPEGGDIGPYAFYRSYIERLVVPEGITTIPRYACYEATKLREVHLPSTITLIESNAFFSATAIEEMYLKAATPPAIGDTWSLYKIGVKGGKLYVPYNSVDIYKANNTWKNINLSIDYHYNAVECESLSIVVASVSGRETTAKIQYVALTSGLDVISGTELSNIEVKGTAISEEFPQNTSYTDTVERTISFTYLGVTATTTITQGVWKDKYYTVDLNSQWQDSATIANPDFATYDGVYESFSNKGKGNTAAIMYIDIVDYETFKLYVRSYAENNYDYVMVSQLDTTIENGTSYSDTALVKAHTRAAQSGGTAISSYKLVEFTEIGGGEHRISVLYRKDSSGDSGTDQGYVLIPKEQ